MLQPTRLANQHPAPYCVKSHDVRNLEEISDGKFLGESVEKRGEFLETS